MWLSVFHKKAFLKKPCKELFPVDKSRQLNHSSLCLDMPNHYSQHPLLCSITNRGAASCLLSGNLAVWHEVCHSKKTPLSFLCLVMSLLGRLHVMLPSSVWFGVSTRVPLWAICSLVLGSGGRQILHFFLNCMVAVFLSQLSPEPKE